MNELLPTSVECSIFKHFAFLLSTAFSRFGVILLKHFTVHIEHGRKTAIANECELIARSGTCHLRPAKS